MQQTVKKNTVTKIKEWLKKDASHKTVGMVRFISSTFLLQLVIWGLFENFIVLFTSYVAINILGDMYLQRNLAGTTRRVIWTGIATISFMGASIIGKHGGEMFASLLIVGLLFLGNRILFYEGENRIPNTKAEWKKALLW